MSVKDSQILRECPFCGGEAKVYEMQYGADGQYSVFGVFCVDDSNSELIGLSKYQHGHFIDNFPTEAEAIAAWNTRTDDYERAAEYWQRMYAQTFAERTCHDTGENEWHFVCSACGYEQNGYECWNYCPNCGARIVDKHELLRGDA